MKINRSSLSTTVLAMLCASMAFAQTTFYIESFTSGGLLTPSTLYVEEGQAMTTSISKSTAPAPGLPNNVLRGTGSRYSSNVVLDTVVTMKIGNHAQFVPGAAYDISVTVPSTTRADAANTHYLVFDNDHPATAPLAIGTVPMTSAACGNKWYRFAANVMLGPGAAVQISEGSPEGNRLYIDAIRVDPFTSGTLITPTLTVVPTSTPSPTRTATPSPTDSLTPTVSPTFAPPGSEPFYIESHTSAGVKTDVSLFETAGSWYAGGSSAKSAAPAPELPGGVLQGVRTEFSENTTIDASFIMKIGNHPTFLAGRAYSIYITAPNAPSVLAPNSKYILYDAEHPTTAPLAQGTVPLTVSACGNTWYLIASNVTLGADAAILISEGSPQTNRFYADAIRVEPYFPPTLTPSPSPSLTPSPVPTPSTVDTDGDGFSDELEIRFGAPGSELDPNQVPLAFDLNGDGKITAADALIFYRNRIGMIPVLTLSPGAR